MIIVIVMTNSVHALNVIPNGSTKYGRVNIGFSSHSAVNIHHTMCETKLDIWNLVKSLTWNKSDCRWFEICRPTNIRRQDRNDLANCKHDLTTNSPALETWWCRQWLVVEQSQRRRTFDRARNETIRDRHRWRHLKKKRWPVWYWKRQATESEESKLWWMIELRPFVSEWQKRFHLHWPKKSILKGWSAIHQPNQFRAIDF